MAVSLPNPGESDTGYRLIAEINVTPLVDVMLVLLVIFMVTAPLMMVGVPVQLPKTSAAKVSTTIKPVVVSINREGRLFVREDEVAATALLGKLAELKKEAPDAPVYVRADRSIPYGRVMEAIGVVTQAGFARVSLIAEGATPPVGTP
ncbi:MAG: protein TolR [Alphaproteobacteria bacterium]|nr:protein TolR [Alphaproteobacteria bacterium]